VPIADESTYAKGIADESTYAKGAEVFKNTLAGQTHLPWPDGFPRKYKTTEAA
jgi:hypothetical protein